MTGSKMVSRWTSKIDKAEIRGCIFSDGTIHYTFIRGGRTTGNMTNDEKEEMLASRVWKFTEVFNEEEQSKEDLDFWNSL